MFSVLMNINICVNAFYLAIYVVSFCYRPQGKVMFYRCLSVHNQPHGYSVTGHPCYGAFGTHRTGMFSRFSCSVI